MITAVKLAESFSYDQKNTQSHSQTVAADTLLNIKLQIAGLV